MEQHQYEALRQDIHDIKSAIMGNPLTNDGGIIGEVREIKATTKRNTEFIERLKWTGGIIVSIAAFFGYLTDKLVSLFTSNH